MNRPLRPTAPGLVYHVFGRGNNRQRVFFADGDYQAFLTCLADLKIRKRFNLFGYCLMPNHFHLLLRTLEANISRIMQSLLISHTLRYHRFHETCGHVWQGRFKSPVVQEEAHLLAVLRYIEANPLRAGMVTFAGDYRWSSFRAHGMGLTDNLLCPLPEYEEFGRTPQERQRRWSAYVHGTPDSNELTAIRESVETGRPYGDQEWIKRVAEQHNLELNTRPRGRPRKDA